MTRQLTLLAGLHKTATTSIQQTCAANIPLLRAAGLTYFTYRYDNEWQSNHTRMLNGMFKREPHKLGLRGQFIDRLAPEPGSREKLRAQVERSLGEAQHLLVAAEGVSMLDVRELRALKDWFSQRGFRIRLLCHVRHLSGWAHSIVSQRVTSPIRMTIPAVIEEFRQHGSVLRGRISNLREVFPEAEFVSHEHAVQHPQGPVGFFFQNIGFTPPAGLKFVRANEGRSDCATRVLSIVNEKFGAYDGAGHHHPRKFRGEAFDQLMKVGGRKFMLRQDEAAPIIGLLNAENEWLRETLGKEFHDEALEFNEPGWQWNPQTMAQLAPAVAAMPPPVRSWVNANLPRIGIRIAAPQ